MNETSSTYSSHTQATRAISFSEVVSPDLLGLVSLISILILLLLSEGNILLGIIS
ncbi:MAG: hypothetical protein M1469_07290 [Bacteroidetes bacterium]|nr:hypothetical protein [Bacteroidota bacterium]